MKSNSLSIAIYDRVCDKKVLKMVLIFFIHQSRGIPPPAPHHIPYLLCKFILIPIAELINKGICPYYLLLLSLSFFFCCLVVGMPFPSLSPYLSLPSSIRPTYSIPFTFSIHSYGELYRFPYLYSLFCL